MAKKKVPSKNKPKPPAKKKAAGAKGGAPKKAAVAKAAGQLPKLAVDCVTAEEAQNAMDGCMATFGVGGLSKGTQIGAALPARVNAFCACIRTSSGVTQASCNGGMTFQQVEIGLVCQ